MSYALGFLEMHLWLRRQRARLGLGVDDVYRLSVWFAAGVLIGGRAIEIAFDEWPFYRDHVWLMPALWLGGMATHGLLIGGATGVWLFSRRSGIPFRELADELVIPGAFLMAVGRVGNFIDGQIVGGVTDVPWAVQFPDAEGFRHPVVLYDAIKNLALIPLLLWVRRRNPTPGAVAAHFVFWYPFLRLFVDLRARLSHAPSCARHGPDTEHRDGARRRRAAGAIAVAASRATGIPAGRRRPEARHAAPPAPAPGPRRDHRPERDHPEQLDPGRAGALRRASCRPDVLTPLPPPRHPSATTRRAVRPRQPPRRPPA